MFSWIFFLFQGVQTRGRETFQMSCQVQTNYCYMRISYHRTFIFSIMMTSLPVAITCCGKLSDSVHSAGDLGRCPRRLLGSVSGRSLEPPEDDMGRNGPTRGRENSNPLVAVTRRSGGTANEDVIELAVPGRDCDDAAVPGRLSARIFAGSLVGESRPLTGDPLSEKNCGILTSETEKGSGRDARRVVDDDVVVLASPPPLLLACRVVSRGSFPAASSKQSRILMSKWR